MSVCFYCKEPLEGCTNMTLGVRGVQTLLKRAIAKNDGENEKLLRTLSEVTMHSKCYRYYSDTRTDQIVRRHLCSNSSKDPEKGFDFANNCIICTEPIQDQNNVSQSQWQAVGFVRDNSLKDTFMDLVSIRTDNAGLGIANRISSVPSLVDVGAKYHQSCSKQLYVKKMQIESKNDELKNNIDAAMKYVFAYIHDNREEGQFFITELIESIKREYVPDKRTVIEQLKARFGNEILFFNKSGYDSIVCFKRSIYEVLLKKSKTYEKNFVRKDRFQKIRDAAEIVLEDIRSLPDKKEQYSSFADFLKNINELVPETLSVLLSEIICKSKRKPLDAVQRKCASIAHSIIVATRPNLFNNADFNTSTIYNENSSDEMDDIECIKPYASIKTEYSSPRVSKKRILASTESTLGLIHLADSQDTTSSNIIEILNMIEKNDYEDIKPRKSLVHSPSPLNTSTLKVEPDPESQSNPSKKLKTQ